MPVLVLALIPPALFAVSNYLDKYLLSRYFAHQGNGALIIFSSLIGLVTLPVIMVMAPEVVATTTQDAVLMILNGMIYVLALLPYFSAMRDDDASVVAPLFQLIPVIGYGLGYIFLGETLAPMQLVAGSIILIGAFVIALEQTADRIRIRWRPLLLMALSSGLMALNSVLFKVFALDHTYWVTSFWGYAGLGLFGLGWLILTPQARREFKAVWQTNSLPALGLNTLNEVVNIMGMLVVNYALLLAPVALIFLAGAAQPLFILAIGILLTVLFPHVVRETMDRNTLIQKGIAIAILVVGAFLLDFYSR